MVTASVPLGVHTPTGTVGGTVANGTFAPLPALIPRSTFLATLATFAGVPLLHAQTPKASSDKVDNAIAKGANFLLRCQENDGAYYDREKGERDRHETALTGLAVLALCGAGHQPADKTPHGQSLKRAVDFLLRADRQDPDGYLGRLDNSRMYGHGIATLALTELLGMGADKNQDLILRGRCRKAIDLILRSQLVRKRDGRHEGGWRYTPHSPDADLSVSVWQLMALRSAKNAGLEVGKDAIDRAAKYLKASYTSQSGAATPERAVGGFAYQPGQRPDYSMTSAGMLAMVIAGHYEAPEVFGAANWLRANKVDAESRWFYYGTYYYAQAMFQRGGDYALEGRREIERLLLPRQLDDGSWHGSQGQEYGVGKIYGTSLALLSLGVRNHYLPIYQR